MDKRVVRSALIVVVGLALLGLLWGLVEPYTISVERYAVELDHLPDIWRERRIAAVSDFQVGMWLDNTWTVDRVVNRLVEMEPSAVLILGDFIYHGGENAVGRIERAAQLVAPLGAAGIPVYAVLGNHDYSVVSSSDPKVDEERALRLEKALDQVGVQVLRNETVGVRPFESGAGDVDGANALYVVGIGAHMPGKDRPEAALRGVPEEAARLVLMHNPETFAAIPDVGAIALAGHTHGGQIRIPFTPEWTLLTYVAGDRVHADGWIEDYGEPSNRLYVNRGIGFSLLPLRINCPPEITLFTLLGAVD